MRLRDLVSKNLDEVVELVGVGGLQRLVHVATAERIVLDPLAQATQTNSERSPAHAGAHHLRDAAGIENPGALQPHSVTALAPQLAAQNAELERMDVLDGSRAGKHHDRICDLAQRKPAHERAAHDGLDVLWR